VVGGGSEARRLCLDLKKKAQVTLISKEGYVLDDFLKLTNAVGLSHFYELNLRKLKDSNLDVMIDEVTQIDENTESKASYSVHLKNTEPASFDEVYLATGDILHRKYDA